MNNVLKLFAICISLALAPAEANAAPSFVNGGFESDSWSPGTVNQITPFGWNAVQSSDSRFVQGSHNTVSTTTYYTPFGNQFIVLCGDDCSPGNYGNVSQTVSGFTPGEQYQLSFDQSPEFNGDFFVQVTIDGGGSLNQVFNANNFSSNTWADWKPQSWTFTANSSTLTFTFAGITGGYESGIDNITLSGGGGGGPTSIPTLSEWGMILLSSLLALGAIFALRRQRL